MKTKDGFIVTSRSYHYLLDWNESDNRKTIKELFNTILLKDLTLEQYKKLWIKATVHEFDYLN